MGGSLVVKCGVLPPMSREAKAKVRQLADAMLQLPQVAIATHHTLHAGLYTRTVMVPAGAAIVGVEIKIPTMLIVSGAATVCIGDETVEVAGYQVFAGAAGRQQAFYAHADTWLTMAFPTQAATVAEAEAEFTDDVHLLASHAHANTYLITGEQRCLES